MYIYSSFCPFHTMQPNIVSIVTVAISMDEKILNLKLVS